MSSSLLHCPMRRQSWLKPADSHDPSVSVSHRLEKVKPVVGSGSTMHRAHQSWEALAFRSNLHLGQYL